MILLMQLEYNGCCKDVIDYFNAINATTQQKTYKEMPQADIFGVSNTNLIWQSQVIINHGEFSLGFEMSDSMLYAMQNANEEKGGLKTYVFPQVFISSIDGKLNFEENDSNLHGIQFINDESNHELICHYFEFDGYCTDVLQYYQQAFNIKATSIEKYENSEKIKSALLIFKNGKNKYAIKLSDTPSSAQTNTNSYDPNALLFYKNSTNPILVLRKCGDEILQNIFNSLSVGAKINKHPTLNENGIYHGSLIDRYGICWELYSN